ARLHCNPSTVVDPTDRLEQGGLVVRQANPADRRFNVLMVTPRGSQVRQGLIERLFEPPEAFRRMSAAEQARFRDVMLAAVNGPTRRGDGRRRACPVLLPALVLPSGRPCRPWLPARSSGTRPSGGTTS